MQVKYNLRGVVMTITKPFNACVTFNGEKYLFKNVYRCETIFIDGAFFFIVRHKPDRRYLSDRFRVDDVNHITKIEYWFKKGGDSK